jgi:flavin reductase (DIM6/NTAB) family NADH-FMN oxidoreductase RutF
MRRKQDCPVEFTRHWLEPGPVVLVSTAHQQQRAIMTCGWHMMLDWDVAATYISEGTRSHELARRSRECVINLPDATLLDTVIGIGNSSSAEVDKFDTFKLTAVAGEQVDAPLIGECAANFECSLLETRITSRYSLFVWQVVKAHVVSLKKYPQTVHYRGNGQFMLSGEEITRRKGFRKDMLPP